MRIENEFVFVRPLEVVWACFQDVPSVSACLPGAQLTDDLGEGRFARADVHAPRANRRRIRGRGDGATGTGHPLGDDRHSGGSGEIDPPGSAPAFVSAVSLTGAYRIPVAAALITCVVTNKTPSGAYRGFGTPEMIFAVERFIDRVARQTGQDRVAMRRELLIRPEDLPYETPAGRKVDSGSHLEAFEQAVAWGERVVAEHRATATGRVGVGYASYLEGVAANYFPKTSLWTGFETSRIRVEPDGHVVVAGGVSPSGQGLEQAGRNPRLGAIDIVPHDDNVHDREQAGPSVAVGLDRAEVREQSNHIRITVLEYRGRMRPEDRVDLASDEQVAEAPIGRCRLDPDPVWDSDRGTLMADRFVLPADYPGQVGRCNTPSRRGETPASTGWTSAGTVIVPTRLPRRSSARVIPADALTQMYP